MAARPAAGPLTPILDPLNDPTTIPPTIPAINPEKSGAHLLMQYLDIGVMLQKTPQYLRVNRF